MAESKCPNPECNARDSLELRVVPSPDNDSVEAYVVQCKNCGTVVPALMRQFGLEGAIEELKQAIEKRAR